MAHVAKTFTNLNGLPGLSEKLLQAHLGLYQGYVNKLNEIEEKLKAAPVASANYSFGDISELHRRRSVAFNGSYLHQLYFENLTKDKTEPSSQLKQAIASTFGSIENWAADVKAGLLTAPGWVLLTRSRWDGMIRNEVIEEHHRGLLVGSDVILAIDGWEHAYIADYSTKKADYIQAVMPLVDWKAASQRFEKAHA